MLCAGKYYIIIYNSLEYLRNFFFPSMECGAVLEQIVCRCQGMTVFPDVLD